MTTALTKESLEEAIKNIQKMVDKEMVNTKPTTIMYQPAAIAAMGLTHDDVVAILEGKRKAPK